MIVFAAVEYSFHNLTLPVLIFHPFTFFYSTIIASFFLESIRLILICTVVFLTSTFFSFDFILVVVSIGQL